MNDKQRKMFDIIDRARMHAAQSDGAELVSVDLNRLSRMVEAESALSSPSCDFNPTVDESTKPVHYMGLFVDRECLEHALSNLDRTDGRLGKKPIAATHLTLAYKPLPQEVPRELFGKRFTLAITGYGYNEENEAVRVELQPDAGSADFDKEACDAIQSMLDSRGVTPHITLSVAEGGKAVNSKDLRFSDVAPIYVGCVFGAHIKEPQMQKQQQTDYGKGPDDPTATGSVARRLKFEEFQAKQEKLNNLVESKNLGPMESDGHGIEL